MEGYRRTTCAFMNATCQLGRRITSQHKRNAWRFSDFATGTSIPAQPRLLPRYTLILRRWKRVPLNPFEANVRFGPEVDVLRCLNCLQVRLMGDAHQYPVISR